MNIEDVIRSGLADPFSEVMKQFVSVRPNETNISFYTGKVVNNNDPDKLGRCKIRVYGVFEDEIPDEDLPWAIPDFNFIGSELGSFIVPPEKTILKVFFDNDDYHTPRYTTKVINTRKMNFDAGKDEDYPNTMVFFETDTGEYFKINRKTNTSTYRHASGTTVSIDKFGNLNILTENTETGDLIIGIEGNTTLTCEGAVTLQGDSVTLKTHDGAMWQPNTVSKCFFNGQHHGGSLIGTGVGGPIEFIEGRDI